MASDDFSAPFAPINATTSPRPMARSTSSSACVAPNRFDTERSESAGDITEGKSMPSFRMERRSDFRQMVIDTKLLRLIFILDIFKYLIIITHYVIPRSASRRERQLGRHAWTPLISWYHGHNFMMPAPKFQ